MITNPIIVTATLANSPQTIFLDSIAMAGFSIQTIVTGSVTYTIMGTLQPVYNLPTFSGSTTGGITPNASLSFGVTIDGSLTNATTGKFFDFAGSLAALRVTVTGSGSTGSVQVIVQQQSALTR